MKITCEHCGCVIHTSKDRKCPNCGAPYKDNKDFKKEKDYDFKERELDLKTKELANQMIEGAIDSKKKIGVVSIVIFAIVAMVFVFIFINARKQINEMHNDSKNNKFINDTIEEYIDQTKEEDVVVKFNEMAETKNFDIKCDKVSSYEYDVFETEKYRGKSINYYNFHIVFKNKTDMIHILDTIALTYTGEDGTEDISAKKHVPNIKESNFKIETLVKDKLTHEGNVTFEIPKSVKDVKIIFKNVTINIEDFKGKMK